MTNALDRNPSSRGTILLFTLLYSLAFIAGAVALALLIFFVAGPPEDRSEESMPICENEDGSLYIVVEGKRYIQPESGAPYYKYRPTDYGEVVVGRSEYMGEHADVFFYSSDAAHSVVNVRTSPTLFHEFGMYAAFVREDVDFASFTADNTAEVYVAGYESGWDAYFEDAAARCTDKKLIGQLFDSFEGEGRRLTGSEEIFALGMANFDPALKGFETRYKVCLDGTDYYCIAEAETGELRFFRISRDLIEQIAGCRLP